MLSKLLNRKATLISRSDSTDKDDYGNAVEVENETTIVCEIQQRQRDESPEGAVSDTEWFGIFPAGTVLDSGDALRVEGLGVFKLDGAPWPARNPRTRAESHVEATLRRTAGSESAT